MELSKETNKILFVGSERICRQVAYVLAIENYEIVETLTNVNYAQYQDYTIYVCEFKRKSKKLITKIWKSKKDIQYLNDICRQIDKEYVANRRRHRKELRKQLSFKTRISIGIYEYLKKCYYSIKNFATINIAKRRQYAKVKNNNLKVLQYLKASKLFLFVLFAPVSSSTLCSITENNIQVIGGNIYSCCSIGVPFGNLFYDGELSEIYNSMYARIVKLSSLNHSYCLCNKYKWCPCFNRAIDKKLSIKPIKSLKKIIDYPLCITLAFDRTCNLYCKSCRNKKYITSSIDFEKMKLITSKLLKSKYLDNVEKLVVAGSGEAFYSSHYRKLLDANLKRNSIQLLSNGILFNEENWNWIKNKYRNISVGISVDAVTTETYSKLRCGGNFEVLMKNLKMLSKLRKESKIQAFNLNFVVQRDNFREMPDFVRLAKTLNVDCVEFQRMTMFNVFLKKRVQQCCLIIDDKYLDYELWKVLQDPIFKDPIVDLSGLNRYIVASDIKYGKNKC